MMKFTCTRMDIGEIFYVTLVAESAEQAKEMALAATNEKWFGEGGRLRNWSAAVLERDVAGPAAIIDCGRREA
ncbi:MAG TPA: hypothetical protein VND95_08525 [Stellaceae bacterium]|nr:hypothetical protein [Stellaceae bacterium]